MLADAVGANEFFERFMGHLCYSWVVAGTKAVDNRILTHLMRIRLPRIWFAILVHLEHTEAKRDETRDKRHAALVLVWWQVGELKVFTLLVLGQTMQNYV
jgi:hypothetical protein